jgi:solute carrier family 35 protein F5
MPGLQYAIGAALVVAGFFTVNTAALSDVEEKELVHQRDIVEGEIEENTERSIARALSRSEQGDRRESNASALSVQH